MTHNEQVLNREYDKWLMSPYMEEYPAPEPAPTAFEDAEQQISSYVNEYIADNDEMPDMEEVFDMFNLRTDADWEALEQYFKREMEMTEWNTPSLK